MIDKARKLAEIFKKNNIKYLFIKNMLLKMNRVG
jgi:hypothetical protein